MGMNGKFALLKTCFIFLEFEWSCAEIVFPVHFIKHGNIFLEVVISAIMVYLQWYCGGCTHTYFFWVGTPTEKKKLLLFCVPFHCNHGNARVCARGEKNRPSQVYTTTKRKGDRDTFSLSHFQVEMGACEVARTHAYLLDIFWVSHSKKDVFIHSLILSWGSFWQVSTKEDEGKKVIQESTQTRPLSHVIRFFLSLLLIWWHAIMLPFLVPLYFSATKEDTFFWTLSRYCSVCVHSIGMIKKGNFSPERVLFEEFPSELFVWFSLFCIKSMMLIWCRNM